MRLLPLPPFVTGPVFTLITLPEGMTFFATGDGGLRSVFVLLPTCTPGVFLSEAVPDLGDPPSFARPCNCDSTSAPSSETLAMIWRTRSASTVHRVMYWSLAFTSHSNRKGPHPTTSAEQMCSASSSIFNPVIVR